MKKTGVLILFLNVFILYSQNTPPKKICGFIKADKKLGGDPLSKAYIYYKNHTAYGVSNLSGAFCIDAIKDTLIIKKIGYQTIQLPTEILDSNVLEIVMTASPSILAISKFKNDKASQVIQTTIKNLEKNYPNNINVLDGWYRNQIIEDSLYCFFGQAALSLHFTTQRIKNRPQEAKDLIPFIKVQLDSSVVSYDARDTRLNFKASLYELLLTGVFQNDIFLDYPSMFNFRLGRLILWGELQLYEIFFEVKEAFKDNLEMEGRVFIDTKTHAIVHKKSKINIKPHKIKGNNALNAPFTAIFTTYSYIITTDYEQIKNQWRPKFIQREWQLKVYSKEFPGISHHYLIIDDYYTLSQKTLTKISAKFDKINIDIDKDMKEQMQEFGQNQYFKKLKNYNFFILPDLELDRYKID